ncbi:MAG: EutN/CcmL family microcompartment protein [Candidatus Muirbacterium halophilum]|nr:EutN/CcmL family microcompartment protein [Candidatus Muirbacterium halophilum]MCK9475287.1 EutN/CcmL family microcompartment protein [Candidatus Muirbacterium halophilum]
MILGKVIGTIVSTKKDERLVGFKLLVVREYDVKMNPTSSTVVAVDTVGAGFDELVLVVSGSSARQTAKTDKKPVDAAIVGIVDSVSLKEE